MVLSIKNQKLIVDSLWSFNSVFLGITVHAMPLTIWSEVDNLGWEGRWP